MTKDVIKKVEDSQIQERPDFKSGDTVEVQVKVTEGKRTRLQAFEGLVISVKKRGLNSSFVVRKISNGVGVERIFPLHSPILSSIQVKRQGKVRRAKLNYLKNVVGVKAARIKEKKVEKK